MLGGAIGIAGVLAQIQMFTDRTLRTASRPCYFLHELVIFLALPLIAMMLLFTYSPATIPPLGRMTWAAIIGAIAFNDVRTLHFPGNIWYGISLLVLAAAAVMSGEIGRLFQMGIAWALAMVYAFIVFVIRDEAGDEVGGGDLKVWPLLAYIIPSPFALFILLFLFALISFGIGKLLQVIHLIRQGHKRPAYRLMPGIPMLFLAAVMTSILVPDFALRH